MEFELYLLYMEDKNLLNYNQHQMMKRAPNLITGPSLVFLTPTKKGLRSPILKCKIILASNHNDLLHNQPMLCISISTHQSTGQHCSLIFGQYSHPATQNCCSSQLLINLWSSSHQPC